MLEQILNPQNKQEKVQIAFTFASGCLGLLASALFPFPLMYLAICGTIYQIAKYLPQWENITQTELPAPLEIEPPTRWVIGGIVGLLGLYLTLSPIYTQILVCTMSLCLSGSFFIHQCVMGSQMALNNALQQAVSEANLGRALILLERGADPYAPNLAGENCFHLAIQNNQNSLDLLNHLKLNQPIKLDLKDIVSPKHFLDDEMKKIGKAWWITIKAVLQRFHQETRIPVYQATNQFWLALLQRLGQSTTLLTSYLRQELRFSKKKINAKNQAGFSPLDLLNLHPDIDNKEAFAAQLTALGATQHPSDIPTSIDIDSKEKEKEKERERTEPQAIIFSSRKDPKDQPVTNPEPNLIQRFQLN